MFKVYIIESERGWGQKIDKVLDFDTKSEALKYVADYNAKYNTEDEAPDWYMVAQYAGEAEGILMLSTECSIGTRVSAWCRLPSGKPLKRGTMAWQEGTVIENHHVKLDRGPTVGVCKVILASPSSEGLSR